MSYETLLYEQDAHVVTLTYNRPDQHNAVNRRMNAELHHAWQRFRDDDDAFVLVLTGAGETTFCAGWDLQDAADLSELGDYDAYRVSLHNSAGECGYTRKADVFKPVIAAVNGWAVAAGLENALLADIRIVARDAVFGALERRWNIVAGDGMTVRLPLVVGYARAMEMIITGRPVNAEEALRIGLAHEVVPTEEVLPRARTVAAALVESTSPTSWAAVKEQLLADGAGTFDESMARAYELMRSSFRRASIIGWNALLSCSAAQRHSNTSWPCASSERLNSRTRRDLPIPASPTIRTTRSAPVCTWAQ